ncbi:NERD domain-containing protein [Ruminococcus sp.]|uniref:NERD domain-containing protein n=1 Tax=Ruminococcus sp. TaxID=41978 RepID=UPI0025DC2B22|nr:NERD domain-containing protein [Ruminococcus sp.]
MLDSLRTKLKGYAGERTVSRHLHRLSRRSYIILDDLMLLTGKRLTQIDHIVVSVYGIFVIETKNYQGRICGSDRAENWTQELHGKKYPFRNPFRQNYAHIQALKALLELEDDDLFISMAAFSDKAELNVNTEQELVHFSKLRRAIRAYRHTFFSWDTVQYMAGTILCANVDSKAARKQLLDQIDSEIAYQNFALRNGLCPRCGGTLLLRHGAYGDFYGCSRFPDCRYTLRAEEDES